MSFKPGCYASPTCFHEDRAPCTVCPYAKSCGTAAESTAEKLRSTYRINALLSQTLIKRRAAHNSRLVAATSPPNPALRVPGKVATQMPVKSMELQVKLDRRGVDLAKSLTNGINAFATQPPAFMRVVIDALLGGGFTRVSARERLVKDLGWTDASASSHVGMVIPVLRATGVVREVDGAFRIGAMA